MRTYRIQFVCLGNICRSPAAQGVMQSLVDAQNLGQQILVDSAGTAGYHIGRPPDRRMIEAAERRSYHLLSQAKQFDRVHLSQRDLVIAMDRENFRDIQRLHSGLAPHVRLFSDFLDESWPRDVPDPYYGGEEGFVYVLEMLEAGCPKILKEIQEKLSQES
jgi:protein-tyrosine phosphatase